MPTEPHEIRVEIARLRRKLDAIVPTITVRGTKELSHADLCRQDGLSARLMRLVAARRRLAGWLAVMRGKMEAFTPREHRLTLPKGRRRSSATAPARSFAARSSEPKVSWQTSSFCGGLAGGEDRFGPEA